MRNTVTELITVLTLSKKRKAETFPKIKKTDFIITNFRQNLEANNNKFINSVTKEGDPKEIMIAANELGYQMFKNNLKKVLYWTVWIIEWDRINTKRYGNFQCGIRKNEDIDPKQFLIEQILKGDRSDGVPNILSEDDVFVTGEKQKPMTKKRLEEYSNIDNHTQYISKNYNRNKMLIDLSMIPPAYEESIINSYQKYKVNDRSKLLTYFIENKLKSLMENIGDF